jgi:hypothetical protein
MKKNHDTTISKLIFLEKNFCLYLFTIQSFNWSSKKNLHFVQYRARAFSHYDVKGIRSFCIWIVTIVKQIFRVKKNGRSAFWLHMSECCWFAWRFIVRLIQNGLLEHKIFNRTIHNKSVFKYSILFLWINTYLFQKQNKKHFNISSFLWYRIV